MVQTQYYVKAGFAMAGIKDVLLGQQITIHCRVSAMGIVYQFDTRLHECWDTPNLSYIPEYSRVCPMCEKDIKKWWVEGKPCPLCQGKMINMGCVLQWD
jgi:hypothetical protein